jgi:UDP-glucose 4-epimerase
MTKIGVTGGAGFIGSHVVDRLIYAEIEPVIFDTRGRKHIEDVEVMLGDVRDEVAVTELAAHVDGIIHLAAVLGTQETIKNPRPAVETNCFGGLNVLEACTQYDIPLVNICVGNYWMNNSYSITKNTFERLLEMFMKEHNMRAANVRCVNAYGERQGAAPPFASGKVRKIMPAFICRALTGQDIEIYGDGEQVSDMVYVGDVANTLVASMQHLLNGKRLDRTLEVGPLESNTVNEVAQMVIDYVAINPKYKKVNIVHLPMRPGEIAGAKVTADSNTLRDIGHDPEWLIPLHNGIARTVDWFEQNKGITWQ